MSLKSIVKFAAAGALAVCWGSASMAQSVEEFYRGKTIDMIIGYTPGGGYDQYARLVSRFLGQHMPGKPQIIPRNMPGAASFLAANYIYNVAPKDGTVLGMVAQSVPLSQAMGEPALKLDSSKFPQIGSPAMDNNVVVTWKTSKIKTVTDAQKEKSIMGATGGSTSAQFPTIMNSVLGTKFEIITGYPGGNEINFAMENGEVDGRGSVNWASVKPLGWVEKKSVNVLVQIGLQREPDLPDVPLIFELAQNPEDEKLLRLLSAPTALGRPVITTPDVPADRVQALRDAFDKMVVDPAFLKAAAEEGLMVRPRSGKELQTIVDEIISAPPKVMSRLATFMVTK
ncbi:Bug family tripartite tricarboxylate transporter substrate binding protein [Rhizobium leguminosarum]|uniref:Bug family tripartite tricarboxylate transporter substrate binding protein n=1 Tax=Rhizobium leguminosarum TaxID=384 RepID=UPI001C982A49|nr:tripartite tricarboxylate transporter substrate-binding protein [Rhizobium leguminosarum]MBY5827565.1 hypothetical protein [Rhizobium leguminosarum]